MLADLLLAIGHFLIVFAIVTLLAMELMLLKPGLSGAALDKLGRVDALYGGVAMLLILIGFGRVFLGLKGSDFYTQNWLFWAKIAAFLAMGLLSVRPTRTILAWRRQAKADPAYMPDAAAIAATRRMVHAETAALVLVAILASMMARGIGL
jgi:putative membrane protein